MEKKLSNNESIESIAPLPAYPRPPSYRMNDEESQIYLQDIKSSSAQVAPPAVERDLPEVPSYQQDTSNKKVDAGKHKRRCCSVLWFFIAFDIFATVIAIIGTIGASAVCHRDCKKDDSCYECRWVVRDGSISCACILVFFSAVALIVWRIQICCSRRRQK